jgi:NTP pyrophosphatase (non-canonical NTP hydrolase)
VDFKTYQGMTKRTMPKQVLGQTGEYYDKDAKTNYLMGLAGETGELIDLIKKEWFHGHPENEMEKKLEMGDILHYLTGLCEMFGWSLEEVATLNVMKLSERYPDGFSVEKSVNRKEYEVSSLYPEVMENPKEYLKATEDYLREKKANKLQLSSLYGRFPRE